MDLLSRLVEKKSALKIENFPYANQAIYCTAQYLGGGYCI